jgi:hypothetical protein
VVIEAGELIAFQAACALESHAGRFVAAGGGAEELGERGAKLREGEGWHSFFFPTVVRS